MLHGYAVPSNKIAHEVRTFEYRRDNVAKRSKARLSRTFFNQLTFFSVMSSAGCGGQTSSIGIRNDRLRDGRLAGEQRN
jgi:hypothetical protein